ncbi:hypothetical protein B840_12870 (plasmid) [Corynebacterium marinum DSM 44953]|uniref:VIT family protein n=1 Tax=Corynebacterium marinum DSM 44953 TaxID=1224162 RepID=A0A0B6TJK8_9CORY|nr:hypothetical protein B840_12870 [Corynebacterium marinum DSM 44953]GGO22216.1 membrane protein [Corynebacterium marinum]
MSAPTGHRDEPHEAGHHARLNWLRAGVLGANDGIVSIAALLLGVIATGMGEGAIFLAGMASTIAGAVSMALGEYVSVSAQRDTEKKLLALERRELAEQPEEERQELVGILTGYGGISLETADRAAREIGQKDPLAVHLQLELGMDSEELTSPVAAAVSSAISFVLGALLPLLSVFFAPAGVCGCRGHRGHSRGVGVDRVYLRFPLRHLAHAVVCSFGARRRPRTGHHLWRRLVVWLRPLI